MGLLTYKVLNKNLTSNIWFHFCELPQAEAWGHSGTSLCREGIFCYKDTHLHYSYSPPEPIMH